MTEWNGVFWAGVGLLGLIGSALTSGMEMGFYSLNRVRLDLRAQRAAAGLTTDRAALHVRRELDHPDRLLTTLLVLNNIFNSLVATAATAFTDALGWPLWAIAAANIAVLTPLLLVVGDAVPKEVFRLGADTLTYRLAFLVRWSRLLLTWCGLVPLVVGCGRVVERLGGLRQNVDVLEEPRQRLAALLAESAGAGVLSESQSTLVDRALSLGRLRVRDEMVPWARVHTVPSHADPAAALVSIGPHAHAWYPVVDPKGRVVGVVRLTDLCLKPGAGLSGLIRRPARVDPSTSIVHAMSALRGAEAPVGIVEDHGRPVGMVALRDLAEPLIGDLGTWS